MKCYYCKYQMVCLANKHQTLYKCYSCERIMILDNEGVYHIFYCEQRSLRSDSGSNTNPHFTIIKRELDPYTGEGYIYQHCFVCSPSRLTHLYQGLGKEHIPVEFIDEDEIINETLKHRARSVGDTKINRNKK